MDNVDQSFDPAKIMVEISKAAPLLLLFGALASFVSFGIFAVDYYENLFAKFGRHSRTMGIVIASITELVRFALLVSSIRDFNDEKRFNGWLGLLGSVALVFHDISVARSIASMWDASNPLPYSTVFVFLILLGLGLEIRLILTTSISKNSYKKSKNLGSESKNSYNGKKPKKAENLNGVYTADAN